MQRDGESATTDRGPLAGVMVPVGVAVRVKSGGEHLEPIVIAELAHFPDSPGEIRLACQAMCRGDGDIEIDQD